MKDQTAPRDLYSYNAADIQPAPRTLAAILGKIGPGLILTAAIVGSGELIATTQLGAELGYVALWAVLLSCVVKIFVQGELARYAITTGETGLTAFNHVPGPRLFGVSWTVLAWAITALLGTMLSGAMYGGTAQAANLLFPAIAIEVWVVLLAILTLIVLLTGNYRHVEFGATLMVAIFTLLVLIAAGVLLTHPEYFSWKNVADGLRFHLPEKGILTVVAVFGIVGVNALELMSYPYWAVEKGYARFTGPREDTDGWRERARGWIKVMHVDIVVAMLVYTFATLAFYLLGAGVLHGKGELPKGVEMIKTESLMFTETLGEVGGILFYLGAIAVLYSTIFAGTAGLSRQFADMAALMGRFPRPDYASRLKYQRAWIVILCIVPVVLYFSWRNPIAMVKAGGVAYAILLPIIACGVVYLRHRKLPQELAPSAWVSAALWVTAISICIIVLSYLAIQLGLISP